MLLYVTLFLHLCREDDEHHYGGITQSCQNYLDDRLDTNVFVIDWINVCQKNG